MRRVAVPCLVLSLLALHGCGAPKGRAWVHPEIRDFKATRYQVFPFEDRVKSKKPLITDDSLAITAALEAALDRAGLTMLPRSALDALVADKGMTMTEVTEEQGLELAKELGANAVVYGLLTTLEKGDCDETETAVGFAIKGVKADGWTDLFKGGIERRSAEPGKCTVDAVTASAAEDLVQKLVEGGIGPTNEL